MLTYENLLIDSSRLTQWEGEDEQIGSKFAIYTETAINKINDQQGGVKFIKRVLLKKIANSQTNKINKDSFNFC